MEFKNREHLLLERLDKDTGLRASVMYDTSMYHEKTIDAETISYILSSAAHYLSTTPITEE